MSGGPARLSRRLRAWRDGGAWLEHEGRRIFYRVEGTGPPLLCIHGFPTSSWDWHRVWPDLARRYRVIACDLLGFGFSDKPPDHDYSLLDQATLVEALAARLGVDEAHLLAHDYGDTVAQEILARKLEGSAALRPRSVLFLNGGLIPGSHKPRPIQRLLASPLGGLATRLIGRATFGRSFEAIFGATTRPDAVELDEHWALIETGGGRAAIPRLIRYMREREERYSRWVGALLDTRVPVRLLVGAADPVSGTSVAQRYRTLRPESEVEEIPRIGHYPQLEAPEKVLRALRGFHDTLDIGAG